MSELHYLDQGRGMPVVLIHGFPVDGRIWREQIAPLSKKYRVIVPDLPGFGQSPIQESYNIESVAVQIHTMLKTIDALPCVVGGLSMGGYIALAFYQRFPMDVRGLMLIDTKATGDAPAAKEKRDELIEQVRQQGSRAVVEAMMPNVLSDNTIATEPRTVTDVRQMMQACPPFALEQAMLALRNRVDRTELLPSIAEPVLMLVGQCDTVSPPAEMRQMQRAIPHAELVEVPDAAHFSPIENPGCVNAAIEGFLKKLG